MRYSEVIDQVTRLRHWYIAGFLVACENFSINSFILFFIRTVMILRVRSRSSSIPRRRIAF